MKRGGKRDKKVGTLGWVIAEYRRSPDFTQLRPNTKKTYLIAMDALADGDAVMVSDIRKRHVLQMRDRRADTPGMANLIVAMFSILLRFAADRDYVPYNAATGVKRLRVGEHRRWPEDAIEHAPDALAEPFRRAMLLGLYSGQRIGDCAKMRWDDYDRGVLRVEQEKTGARLWIPCHPDLQRELASWPKLATTILTRADGTPWTGRTLSRAFSWELTKHPMLEGLVFHGLRKSAAARLAEAGCSVHEIAAITGHASLQEVERYTREADQRKNAEAAIVKLGRWKRAENNTD
jgi:integrase